MLFLIPVIRNGRSGLFSEFLRSSVFGLLLVVIGSGLSLSAQDDKKEEKEKAAPVEPEKVEQASNTEVPVSLNVSRRTLTNFLTDRVALSPYAIEGGSTRPFRGAFVIDSPHSQYAVIWHQDSCRVVGVVDLKPVPVAPKVEDKKREDEDDSKSSKKDTEKDDAPPSPYVLKASGAFPLALSLQAESKPSYFGFRMVGDRPEFLYNLENIAVEESIWLDGSGKKMVQRFRLGNREESELKLSFPESWKDRIEVTVGEWKESVLIIPKEDAAEFVLTYRLGKKEQAKESTEKD